MPRKRGSFGPKEPADKTQGPWVNWRGTRAGKAIRFIQTYCRSPKGEGHGKPMHLASFQTDWLEEVLADGVESAVMPTPRGNGKSTFGAAVATWATFADTETGAPQVPIVATTIGQAIRSVYGVAASMVNTEPELRDRANIFTGITVPRIYVPSSEGLMFPVSNEIAGLQGLDPSLAVCDEIGFQSDEVWSALLLAAGKRSRSLIWGTGTPGLDRNNALWSIRERVMSGLTIPGLVWREYAADPGCDINDRAQWRKANPAIEAGFLRESALVNAMGLVPESHFRVFRLGQWVDGITGWLGADGRAVWDALESPFDFVPGQPLWLGVDAALTRDTTAVVAVGYRDEHRLHAKARIWTPTRDEPVDLTDVMGHIRDLADTFRIGAVSYDPRFMDWPAKVLYDEGIPMIELPQSVERMTGVIGDLYTVLREGGLTHDKDDLFASHVLAAVPRLNERGFTLSKGKSRGHIDGVIALGLAVDRVRNRTKPRPPVVVL